VHRKVLPHPLLLVLAWSPPQHQELQVLYIIVTPISLFSFLFKEKIFSNHYFTPQRSQCLSLLPHTLLFRSVLSRTPSASLMSTAPSPPRVWYAKAQSTPDIVQTADNSSGCFPRDSFRPPEASLKVRCRFRRRFRLR
jgi:hypothetical protein